MFIANISHTFPPQILFWSDPSPVHLSVGDIQRRLRPNSAIVKKVKQMIYIPVLCNSRITAEPLYNTPLFIGPYAAANNTALLAWRPLQGTKLYCLVNRGTLGANNLPRVVARIVPRSPTLLQRGGVFRRLLIACASRHSFVELLDLVCGSLWWQPRN